MKKSDYIIRIPIGDIIINYNSYSDEFIALSSKLDKLFSNSEWENILSSHYPNHYKKLRELGFIIDSNRDELSEIRLQNKQAAFNSRELYIMIYPTQDCNLKCWYCYESHVPNSYMSIEIQDRIVSHITKQVELNTFDSLKVAFFGGEPMLKFSTIAYPLAKRLKNIVINAGKRFQTFFVTNATLIGAEEIMLLKEINPYFQITLDGNRYKHNLVRKRKHSSEPTYDSIIKAIKGIVNNIYNISYYKQPIITVRINYDNNTLAHLEELLIDLKDIDRNAIMIHLERVWQTKDSVDDTQRQKLKETVMNLTSHGLYVNHSSFGSKRISCPAESNSYFIVNYDGNLYRCNGRTLMPNQKEGKLTENGDIIWDTAKQSARLGLATFENQYCIKCCMLPRCMGPCSQKLIENGGFSKEICTLQTMDISLNEYLLNEFKKRMSICGHERFN